jgi:ubiquinone/menaquinone biosynthesis C-methylase UbiE
LRILQTLALNAGERVLDVGCGNALLTKEMALAVGDTGYVLGLDSSAEMLAIAKKRCADFQQIELQHTNVNEQLPVEDACFDALTCAQILLYLPDLEKVLSELYRVLTPDGRIVIVESNWHGLLMNSEDTTLTQRIISAWLETVAHPHLVPTLGALLRAHNFKAIRIEGFPIINTNITPGNFSTSIVPWLAEFAQQQGVVNQEEATAWLSEIRQKAATGSYFFCLNRFLFTAIK